MTIGRRSILSLASAFLRVFATGIRSDAPLGVRIRILQELGAVQGARSLRERRPSRMNTHYHILSGCRSGNGRKHLLLESKSLGIIPITSVHLLRQFRKVTRLSIARTRVKIGQLRIFMLPRVVQELRWSSKGVSSEDGVREMVMSDWEDSAMAWEELDMWPHTSIS